MSMPLNPGDPVRLGDYELLGRLGSGGMGTVFLGRGPSGRRVAVKMIRPEFSWDTEMRARFRSEVNRAREVPPFSTAPLLDADPDHDPPYLVVEYVDGPNLQQVVRDNGPLTETDLLGVAVGMATALVAIHGAGVIHRDLKPANVLFGLGGVKVIDFGIARSLELTSKHTRTDQMVGTVSYMAPERFESGTTSPVGPPTDIFSWGVVVAFAATGRTPFDADSAAATAIRIMTQPPDLTGLTGPLRDLVEASLAKNPADRPTARQLLDTLLAAPAVTGPILTRPASTSPASTSPAPSSAMPSSAAPNSPAPSSLASSGAAPSSPVTVPTSAFPTSAVRTGTGPTRTGPARTGPTRTGAGTAPEANQTQPPAHRPAMAAVDADPTQPPAYRSTPMAPPAAPDQPQRRPRRAGLLVTASVLAILATIGVAWATLHPDKSEKSGSQGTDAAATTPATTPTTSPATTPPTSAATTPAATVQAAKEKTATAATIAELVHRMLPNSKLSHFHEYPGDGVQLRLYLDNGDGKGPGQITVGISDDKGTARDRTTKPKVELSRNKNNCVQDALVFATWDDGTVVEVQVSTCLPGGSVSGSAPAALTPAQARTMAKDPRWGLTMEAALVTAGNRDYPALA